MKIEPHKIPISAVTDGYRDNKDEGVVGFSGKLNIRPPYQREFIYKDQQRDDVIRTVKQNFPLNVMYWVKNSDGTFEVLDGQQRTISLCQYVHGGFSLDGYYFHNLQKNEQADMLNYQLMIYFCEGNDKEKLEWFKTINIAGEKLYDQELRNAIYSGPWVTDAKRHFSKNGCSAYGLANRYLKGVAIRQDYLETAIKWFNAGKIEDYMAKNQHQPNANELWLYFKSVIDWVAATFPTYRKEMKGVDWGSLYNQFKDKPYDTEQLEATITKLMQDDDVTKKPGIYPYVLTDEESYLSIRSFTSNQKREAYERQQRKCAKCQQEFAIDDMEADHITPWHEGGKTIPDNCQMLCKDDNRRKAGK